MHHQNMYNALLHPVGEAHFLGGEGGGDPGGNKQGTTSSQMLLSLAPDQHRMHCRPNPSMLMHIRRGNTPGLGQEG